MAKVAHALGAGVVVLCTAALLAAHGGGGLPSLLGQDDPSAVPPFVGHGPCVISQFLPAMSCSKDPESPQCCGGLRATFEARCSCRDLPGIVRSHGGSNLGLLDNYVRCGFTSGVDVNGDPIPPVDYVTEHQGCADRKQWCAPRPRRAMHARMQSWPHAQSCLARGAAAHPKQHAERTPSRRAAPLCGAATRRAPRPQVQRWAA